MTFVGNPEQLDSVPVTFTEAEGGCYSAFMVAPQTIEKVGWFDEGFYPAYYEDNDYDRRIKLLGLMSTKTTCSLFICGRSTTIAHNQHVQAQINKQIAPKYYREKWGGLPSQEQFTKPFNDENKPLTYTKQNG